MALHIANKCFEIYDEPTGENSGIEKHLTALPKVDDRIIDSESYSFIMLVVSIWIVSARSQFIVTVFRGQVSGQVIFRPRMYTTQKKPQEGFLRQSSRQIETKLTLKLILNLAL